MAKKKIRFTLEMMDGVQARTLEDVQKNFSLEKVLVYIEDGRMDTWLRERYQNNIADGIAALDKADSDYNKKLYALFGVDYDEAEVEEMAKAANRTILTMWITLRLNKMTCMTCWTRAQLPSIFAVKGLKYRSKKAAFLTLESTNQPW